ncbi:MAG: lysophospholipase [Rickettsiaceae bacterium]|nr:lysophospholipase [Rickettsiaceae bacterium]MDP4832972.1 lysophospholipase [Rickettsiaceae bacterium]MDP5020512.1 lysophospholipase [Rickettsiaceae bacterium]MDP5083642.1 lysophospholipase [Rickettsiaceae bacterium]
MTSRTVVSNKLVFKGSLGDSLVARLDAPESPIAYVLFAHYFTGNKDISALSRISRALNQANIALFRFDYTGLGASGGNFANTNFSSNVKDLIAAANFMREHYQAPQIVVGHSLGGTAAIAAASEIPEVKAVATIGSPCDTEHVQHNFAHHIDEINEKGEAEVILGGKKFNIKKQFLDDINSQNMPEKISNLRKALLVMHSPVDGTVGIENAQRIYELAKHPKSFISLDNADHLLMRSPIDSKYVAEVLAAWASRYLNN